jgi:hypothetical protein
MSPYLARLRGRVGHELIMLPGVSACVFDGAGRVLLAHHADTGYLGAAWRSRRTR